MSKTTVAPLFLVGYMGSGKSTIGRLLSDRLHRPFFDTDTLLERHEGVSCSALMQQVGEAVFREKERAILRPLLHKQSAIIATGGGLPCYKDNMELMCASGRVVYLQWSVEELASRLEQTDLTTRPMLQGKTAEALRSHITAQLDKRVPFYRRAQHHFACDTLTAGQLLEQVVVWLNGIENR